MSIPVSDRVDSITIEDVSVQELSDFFNDLDDLEDYCDDMIILYEREQISTLGSEKFLKILEKEARLIEDIARQSCRMLREHRRVIDAVGHCSETRKTLSKPKK
ncbi:hypothetical protein KM1_216120 [Entamoeba histolytica HM-3:IMSS]|uniref:Uncharacterized protein n=1 Tax=Entamoeba histolytica HM-3:IMSS TaxID=885315 RepID=M7WKA9_ENTHI|nr:hypothetical protein KM1_216120 [Entamoeba histolytica HM-3:IMSS]